MRYLSLFSGIEAASQAWEPLGWECVGFSEIEPFPSRLLAARWPAVRNLGDVTKITEADIAMLGHIDLIVFGSPCQDLSVAGKRKGLEGARSGLFKTAIRIIGWAREWCDLRGALWENVPGAFSSNKGADFAAVVDALAGLEPGTTVVPETKKWGSEGAALGPLGLVEWATLDAQWFGVAQRRRRVFALADFGDWTRRPPVLLEPEGLRGDSAPRRGPGEEVAGTLASRTGGGGFPGSDEAMSGYVQPVGRPVLSVIAQNGSDIQVGDGTTVGTLSASQARYTSGDIIAYHEVVSTLDASYARLQGCSGQDMNHGHSHLVAYGGNNTSKAIDVAPALLAQGGWEGDFESETFLAYMPARELRPDGTVVEHFGERDVCDALHTASGSGNKAPLIAFPANLSGTQHASAENLSPSLCAKNPTAVAQHMAVRRLTPRECERLQGMADDYTLIAGAKDGPRYKALGNSMAVPVMNWIGRQIDYSWTYF